MNSHRKIQKNSVRGLRSPVCLKKGGGRVVEKRTKDAYIWQFFTAKLTQTEYYRKCFKISKNFWEASRTLLSHPLRL